MIKKIDNKNKTIAEKMQSLFQASYKIEAEILNAENFPPLSRTLEQYIVTDTEFYGCWQEQQLAGIIELRCENYSIHIQSLVVDPQYFRQGVASKLLNHVLMNFGSPLITVETGAANTPAIILYEKHGFIQIKDYVAAQNITKTCFEKQTKISVLGCGWLGLPLAQSLLSKGYEVKGSTTTAQKIPQLETAGLNAYQFTINKLNSQTDNFFASDILVVALAYKNINDFNQLVKVIEQSSIKKVIFISSTSVYPSKNTIVDETTPTLDTNLAQIEELFRDNGYFKSAIIRFAGLYGYNRKPGNFIKNKICVKNPEGFVNMIHRDDCIAVIKKLIKSSNVWSHTFNACADDHPSRRDYYTQACCKLGLKTPDFDEESQSFYKIVSNEKLKTLLNYQFKHSKLM